MSGEAIYVSIPEVVRLVTNAAGALGIDNMKWRVLAASLVAPLRVTVSRVTYWLDLYEVRLESARARGDLVRQAWCIAVLERPTEYGQDHGDVATCFVEQGSTGYLLWLDVELTCVVAGLIMEEPGTELSVDVRGQGRCASSSRVRAALDLMLVNHATGRLGRIT